MQCRAARGLLQWSQKDLAREAGISALTIRNYEKGKTKLQHSTMIVLRQTFEDAGIEFSDDGFGLRRKPGQLTGGQRE